jgi:hypothetical protein
MVRLLLIIVVICFGCQTGKIPCPKFKGAKSGNNSKYRNYYSASLSTEVEDPKPEKLPKSEELKFVYSVSVEEWDCPQPGKKKFLPRNVRDNIRKNAKHMDDYVVQVSADSTIIE